MATVREYFDTDFRGVCSVEEIRKAEHKEKGLYLEVIARVHLDYDAYTKYVSYYVIETNNLFEACVVLIQNPEWALDVADRLRYQPQFTIEQQPHSSELPFSGRVYIYAEDEVSSKDLNELKSHAQKRKILFIFRSLSYVEKRIEKEKPLAFISHDSRDKDEIARPLAQELARHRCPVWFDEYSLRIGTSLRESIERGLKECSKCVLIISPNFLENKGWTKTEFNSIFTREILEESNYVLPVWVNVSAKNVYEYSPLLADKVAIKWNGNAQDIASKLFPEILDAGDTDSSSYRTYSVITESIQSDEPKNT
jgi:hypothetical protein